MADINTLSYRQKTARNLVDLNHRDPFAKNGYNERILEDAAYLCSTFPEARYESSGTETLWSIECVHPDGGYVRRMFYVRRDAVTGAPLIYL